MSQLATIKLLVKEIATLSHSLSDSVPKGSKDGKIWSVMNTEEADSPHETFNRRFDALFGEDCRDEDGHLRHVHQGKLGMGLINSYLSKINWTKGFPFDLVEIKLQCLVTELKHHQYVPDSNIPSWCFTDKLSDEQMYHDQHVLSILLQNLRTQPIPRCPSCPSSVKPSKSFILVEPKIPILRIHRPRILTHMHHHHPVRS